jgi:hypothetical protein
MALPFMRIAEAQVIVYEGDVYPEETGWERRPLGNPQGERSLEGGWFIQTVRLPAGWPEPTGEFDFYRMPLTTFAGADAFFVEWRAVTDNPSWLLSLNAVPTVVSAAGSGAAFYHTTMTSERVQFFRDTKFPLVFVDITSGTPHEYRLEVRTVSYAWYIDGVVVESGKPQGPYPYPSAFLIWGAGREYVDATTAWDFVRAGVIPEDASGDYDSDGAVTEFDYYFAHDCLTKDGPGIFGGPGKDAGPGCRFVDYEADSDADLFDFAEFANHFTGP